MSGGDARLRELERRGLAGDMDAWRQAMRERIRRGLGPLVEAEQSWRLRGRDTLVRISDGFTDHGFDDRRQVTADVFLVRPTTGIAVVHDRGTRGPNKPPPGFEQGHGFGGYAVRWATRVPGTPRAPGGWQSGSSGRDRVHPSEFGVLELDRDEAYKRALSAATAELVVDDDLYQTEGPMENPRRKNPDDELRRLEREYATTKDPILLRRIRAERARRGERDPELAWILDKAVSWGADVSNVVSPPRDTANWVVAGIYFRPNSAGLPGVSSRTPGERAREFVDAVRAKHWHCEWAILYDHDRSGVNVTLEWLDREQDPEHEYLHVDTTMSSDPVPVPVVWNLDSLDRVQAVPGSPMRLGWLRLPGDWIVDLGPKDRSKQVRVIVSSRYTEPMGFRQAIELAQDAAREKGLIRRRATVQRARQRVERTNLMGPGLMNNPGVKRNMDERARRLERSGADPIDIVRQRLRSGKISPEDLKWAEALTWTNGPASSHGLKRFTRADFGEQLLALMDARGEKPVWDQEHEPVEAQDAEADLGHLPNSQVVMSECSGSRYGEWQVQTVDSPDSDDEVADQAELLQAYIDESGSPKSWQEWGDPVGWWYVRKLAYEKDPVALSWLVFLLRFNWNNAWEILRYGHVFDDEKHPRASVRRRQLAEYVDALIGHLLGGPPL